MSGAEQVVFKSTLSNTWHRFGDPANAGDTTQLSGLIGRLFHEHKATAISVTFADGETIEWMEGL